MPYGHLIAATVMTMGVCQGHSWIASFSMLTNKLCGPSAIAELLVQFRLDGSFVLLGEVIDCWQSFDVPSSTTSAEA